MLAIPIPLDQHKFTNINDFLLLKLFVLIFVFSGSLTAYELHKIIQKKKNQEKSTSCASFTFHSQLFTFPFSCKRRVPLCLKAPSAMVSWLCVASRSAESIRAWLCNCWISDFNRFY